MEFVSFVFIFITNSSYIPTSHYRAPLSMRQATRKVLNDLWKTLDLSFTSYSIMSFMWHTTAEMYLHNFVHWLAIQFHSASIINLTKMADRYAKYQSLFTSYLPVFFALYSSPFPTLCVNFIPIFDISFGQFQRKNV